MSTSKRRTSEKDCLFLALNFFVFGCNLRCQYRDGGNGNRSPCHRHGSRTAKGHFPPRQLFLPGKSNCRGSAFRRRVKINASAYPMRPRRSEACVGCRRSRRRIFKGVFQATQFGSACTQPGLLGAPPHGREDCLVLNVYTPHQEKNTNTMGSR